MAFLIKLPWLSNFPNIMSHVYMSIYHIPGFVYTTCIQVVFIHSIDPCNIIQVYWFLHKGYYITLGLVIFMCLFITMPSCHLLYRLKTRCVYLVLYELYRSTEYIVICCLMWWDYKIIFNCFHLFIVKI